MNHLTHYIVLFGIFGTAIFGFILFSWDRAFQVSIIIATAASYISWGIVHHFVHRDLYPEVVVEYTAIAALGSILALTLLL